MAGIACRRLHQIVALVRQATIGSPFPRQLPFSNFYFMMSSRVLELYVQGDKRMQESGCIICSIPTLLHMQSLFSFYIC
jgi:hypothetical protein